MAELRHFLDLHRIDKATLRQLLDDAVAMKADSRHSARLPGCVLALIFEKPSTRTRVSFEVAIRQLGGSAIVLDPGSTQLGRGETIGDTARVLSQYVDAIMLRTSAPENLMELAEGSSVPVINGLTDVSHPCQLMADIMTFEEYCGPIAGKVVAWSGDGNNVAQTWIHAAVQFDFELRIATPPALQPPVKLIEWARSHDARVSLFEDPHEAADGVDCIVTDTWVSMGDEAGAARHKLLAPYRVDGAMMACANAEAIFMHCLPAHRGKEVTADVIDGPQSVVWVEAGNRLHVQKSILLWCLNGGIDDA